MRSSKRSSSTDHSLLSLYTLYPLCQFSGFLTRQCSSSHIHFHCYHSPLHQLLLVPENKPQSVIAVLVGFYRHSIKLPTHFQSSFILCGVIIIIIIIYTYRYGHCELVIPPWFGLANLSSTIVTRFFSGTSVSHSDKLQRVLNALTRMYSRRFQTSPRLLSISFRFLLL